MKRLSKAGKEYVERNGLLQDYLDDGFEREDIIQAINTCVKMDGMDLGDELGLFLAGMEYQKNKKRTKKK